MLLFIAVFIYLFTLISFIVLHTPLILLSLSKFVLFMFFYEYC